jgi:hypothetical protein
LLSLINTATCWLQMLTRHTQIRTIIKAPLLPQTPLVDFVKIVCLQDFQETAPPPSRNTYPLVA